MDKSQEKTAETNEKRKGPFPAVPTTKVLAIGRFLAPPTPEQVKAIFPKEKCPKDRAIAVTLIKS